MIASLPMYDRPEVAGAYDALWTGISAAYDGPLPKRLTRDGDPWDHWQSEDLVFSQTCGLPFRARLSDRLDLVGTPDFALPDCPPGYYFSVVVVRGSTPGGVLAVNDGLSQSGWAAAVADGAGFERVVQTGSHRASAQAVAEGRADFAYIDAVTWRMMERWDPWVASLRVVGRTASVPGLPYVTRSGGDVAGLRGAVETAIAGLNAQNRDLTGLRSVVNIPKSAYLALPPVPPLPR